MRAAARRDAWTVVSIDAFDQYPMADGRVCGVCFSRELIVVRSMGCSRSVCRSIRERFPIDYCLTIGKMAQRSMANGF